MATSRRIVTFDRFDGGEWGRLNAWNAPKNTFTASNMILYSTGELGVRPGLKNQSPSGLATGLVQGFGTTPVPGKDAWFIQGTAFRYFDILGASTLVTAATAVSATPTTHVDAVLSTTNVALTCKSWSASYLFDTVAGTLTALTGAPSGGSIAIYGDRMVIGNVTGSLLYRMRYSDAANYNSWPAASFIDIGDNWHISGLYAQRGHLLVVKQEGFYIVTGVLGENSITRKALTEPAQLRPTEGVMVQNDTLYTFPVNMPFPTSFNGTELRRIDQLTNHLSPPNSADAIPPEHGVASISGLPRGAAIIQKTGNKGMFFLNGAWTYQTFGVNVSGLVPHQPNQQYLPICDGGAVGVAPKFYLWNAIADSPGLESGAYMRAGDDSSTALTGSVTFPEYHSESGAEFRVRAVIVDFRKWNTGSSTTNHFDLAVHSLRRYNGESPQAAATQSWDEAAGSASTSGTIDREIIGVGDQGVGDGFQLVFTNVRGIAFQRIQVVIDDMPVRV